MLSVDDSPSYHVASDRPKDTHRLSCRYSSVLMSKYSGLQVVGTHAIFALSLSRATLVGVLILLGIINIRRRFHCSFRCTVLALPTEYLAKTVFHIYVSRSKDSPWISLFV